MIRFQPRLCLAAMAAAATLAACAQAPQSPPSVSSAFVAINADGDRGMTSAEPGLIAASHGRARREGDNLILTYANGHTRAFHNNNKGCEDGPGDCDGYILIGDLPGFHWFVLFETAYEGGRFLLVDDRSGLPTYIPFWPTFSADGSRLLIQCDDESGFFDCNTLEIWRREGNRMEPEWIANPDESDTGVPGNGFQHTRLLSWTKDRITLEFRADEVFNVKTRQRTPERRWTGTITHTPQGWLLNARAPKP